MEIYRKVDEKYPNSTSMEKAWIGCRLLGGLCYGDYADTVKNQIQWNDLANKVFDSSESEERKYYTETLGLSLSEYIELREFIRAQHNDAPSYDNGDFSHMQISLAARLACALDKDGVASNVYGDDETASYYAGWLGDAVIGNPPSFGNDDYIADLDAENIYHQISRGNTIVIASHLYFQELISETRAKIFAKHISYELVKEKVGIGLLADDNYTLEEIIDTYPDTYNFLCSIRDGLNEIRNYIE